VFLAMMQSPINSSVEACHNPHETGFAGAVAADNTNPCAEEERKVYVFKDGFGAVLFCEIL
jgi:hypothetical protein